MEKPTNDQFGPRWPTDIPENCPPDSAIDVKGRMLYRFVRGASPQKNDFLSHFQLGLAGREECIGHGLSVLTQPGDVTYAREVVPAFRKMQVACGSISENMGVIKHTATFRLPNHHTWWIPDNCVTAPETLFQVVSL